MRFTKRDLKLFNFLVMFQCLTALQISLLLEMEIKNCQRRLRKLCKDYYLQKLPMPTINNGRNPYLFSFGSQASLFLDVPVSKPRFTLQLSHQQKNTDLMIQIMLSFRDFPIECHVLPEHLIRTTNYEMGFIPDGAFMLENNSKKALFLLENCSGTEIIKSPSFYEDIESKIIRYTEAFSKNEVKFYSNYFGNHFQRFRMLFIANDFQRMRTISEVVAEHDKHGFIWLTTLNDFKRKGISGNIWVIPSLNKNGLSII